MKLRISTKLASNLIIGGLVFTSGACVALGVTGYFLYKKVAATEAAQKLLLANQTQAQTDEQERAQALILAQQQALEQTKSELTATKTSAAKTDAQIKSLSQTVKEQSSLPKDIIISSSDLSAYVTGVVQVICTIPSGISSGSGTLWTFKEVPYAVVTNYHVVKDASRCVISITNAANATTGIFSLKGEILTFNKNTDEAILTIGSSISNTSVPVQNYDYALATLRKCPSLMPVGTPAVVIGYPAYAKRDSTLTIETMGTVNVIYRTVTNGIISGYDTSQAGDANYFVSAKIDNGNSGGMALAKDKDGLCVLGLPTWLTVGNYETQGLVQNITNVLPKN
jgi:S1-C subfamily serine protease